MLFGFFYGNSADLVSTRIIVSLLQIRAEDQPVLQIVLGVLGRLKKRYTSIIIHRHRG